MNMNFERKLPIPMEVKEMYPLSAKGADLVERRRIELEKIFTGKDERIVLIIGPCSADNEDSVMDYITRLAGLQQRVKDKIMIVPRIYTNKPRTTGQGYKGLVHQPDPTGNPDAFNGIIATRQLHMRQVNRSPASSPAQTRCSTRKTTSTSTTSWAMWPWAPARWKTRSTAWWPAASRSPWA